MDLGWLPIVGGLLDPPPDGPTLPFGTPAIAVLDSVRIFIITALLAYVLSVPFIMWRARRVPGQALRNAGAALIALGVVQSEAAHFGDYASPRLGAYLAGSVFIAWGLYSMFRYEEPPRLHLPHRTRRRRSP